MERIVVLLSTYNGEQYLQTQLDSLYAQEGVSLRILVRDDGSSDATCALLEREQAAGRLCWYGGENKKPARSFLDLVYHAPDAEYYAFCDQDDFWLHDKLSIAVSQLKKTDPKRPALYYGRPRRVDSQLMPAENPSRSLHRMLTFKSALINSNATGCTMVFNRSLLELIRDKEPVYLPMHDTWLHKVCLVANGQLLFDDDVHILYRQHGNNVIGISISGKDKLRKHLLSLKTQDCSRSRTIRSLLDCYGSLMNEEDHALAEKVVHYKDGLVQRLSLALDPKIRSGYLDRDILFRLAVLLDAY